jgi:hypothetical protein
MNPREEADMLMIKMSKWSREEYYLTYRESARQCALIYVEGMLGAAGYMSHNVRDNFIEHWSKVKEILENGENNDIRSSSL